MSANKAKKGKPAKAAAKAASPDNGAKSTARRPSLFRREAEEAHEGAGQRGVPLALAPRWINRTYWVIVAAVATALLFAVVAKVGEYAHGPAVVRALGRLDLTTTTGGIVMAIDVEPGAQVVAGQTLVRFHTENERQELDHLDREFELKLVRILLHPGDEAARQSMASLRASRELAAARLKERQVVAPSAGVVRNLRIRPGQMLAPGDLALTLVDEANAAFSVVALVPGQFRPMLKAGMPLRFELEGYPQIATELTVEAVGDEAVGPTEVRRTLGQELGDTMPMPLSGSMVLVRARLPQTTFRWKGQTFSYYDGIPGQVDVRVRSLSLLAMLFPAFEEMQP
jgi:multidrug efflux pump subunit AcrA (membrane-fusion protein)